MPSLSFNYMRLFGRAWKGAPTFINIIIVYAAISCYNGLVNSIWGDVNEKGQK